MKDYIGKRAIPLALLGSKVTVFDISDQNKDVLQFEYPSMDYFSKVAYEGACLI